MTIWQATLYEAATLISLALFIAMLLVWSQILGVVW